MKTRSLMTLHALVKLYSNSDARQQSALNQSFKNSGASERLGYAHHLGRFNTVAAPIRRERLHRPCVKLCKTIRGLAAMAF